MLGSGLPPISSGICLYDKLFGSKRFRFLGNFQIDRYSVDVIVESMM